MPEATVFQFPSPSQTDADYYRSRAHSLLSKRLKTWEFDHFAAAIAGRWASSLAGSGAPAYPDEVGGVVTLATGTTGNSVTALVMSSSVSNPQRHIASGSSGEWYLGARMKIDTLTNAVQAGVITWSGSLDMQFGVRIASSATNWIARGNGQTINSGVAVSASTYAVLELVRVSGITTFYINGAIVGTSTTLFPTANVALLLYCGNDSAASAVNLGVDWAAVGAP